MYYRLKRKEPKMLKRYTVTVQETYIDSGLELETRYVRERLPLSNDVDVLVTSHKYPEVLFTDKEAAESFMQTLPEIAGSTVKTKNVYGIEELSYTHANRHGYSDTHPFEIVKVISPKTIEIRPVDAELDPSWKPEVIAGGFAGHTVNNGSQKWVYTSNPDNPVIRARLRKDGYFYAYNGRHILGNSPEKFYDYNF